MGFKSTVDGLGWDGCYERDVLICEDGRGVPSWVVAIWMVELSGVG